MSLTDSPDFDIRYSTGNDVEALRSWLQTEGMMHWYYPSNGEELENFIRIWVGFMRYNASLTATYQHRPIGMTCLYLMPYRKVAHQALLQIIVDPEHQRKGVGRSLIRNLKHLAKTYFHLELLSAEILDEGPLISLLNTLDFSEFARQEHYIKEDENYFPRILMETHL